MNDIPVGICQCGCGRRTPLATCTNTKAGRYKGKPCRYLPGHSSRWPYRAPEERFWSNVERRGPDECWPWQGCFEPNAYCRFHLGKKNGKLQRIGAHVFVAELALGPVPPGLQVNHHCDMRRCCNPRHLYFGTQTDNMRDARARGRMKLHLENLRPNPSGEKASGTKLSATDVMEIVRLRQTGVSGKVIAARFNIHRNTAWQIGRGALYPEALAQYLALKQHVSSDLLDGEPGG